jgi:hypothetical protein
MPKFPTETNVPKSLAIPIISYLLLYKLVIYHRKGLEESYKFVAGSTSMRS